MARGARNRSVNALAFSPDGAHLAARQTGARVSGGPRITTRDRQGRASNVARSEAQPDRVVEPTAVVWHLP